MPFKDSNPISPFTRFRTTMHLLSAPSWIEAVCRLLQAHTSLPYYSKVPKLTINPLDLATVLIFLLLKTYATDEVFFFPLFITFYTWLPHDPSLAASPLHFSCEGLARETKERRGYSDGRVIPTVALISTVYCEVRWWFWVSIATDNRYNIYYLWYSTVYAQRF